MKAATLPPAHRDARSLVILDGDGEIGMTGVGELHDHIESGSVLVLNDAATLPASLSGVYLGDDGPIPIEIRLARHHDDGNWTAISFAEGSWRERTEDRAHGPALLPGGRMRFKSLHARVVSVDVDNPRMLRVAFDAQGPDFLRALYREGRLIQYSYLERELALWSAQTLFAGRPWAVEMPSAGHPLNATSLSRLRRKGVEIRRLTHAAGLSSTGQVDLDARLPLPERYDIPADTAKAVESARAEGRRVIAVGTTVVRALESAAIQTPAGLGVRAGRGLATLRLGPHSPLRCVDAILTGLHLPGESHFELLQAFAPRDALVRTMQSAALAGLRNHEFGDLALVQRWQSAAA